MPPVSRNRDQASGDPRLVETLPELIRALNMLRGTRSYADLDRTARGHGGLARSTASNLLNGKGIPTGDTLIKFLHGCGLGEQEQAPWLAAWERVSTADLRRPPGAVRVREARPRLLGVHAAIQVADTDSELPVYVPRDLDADLRTAITAASRQGGLVMLIGGSSVGKTRALPEWWLIQPAGAGAIRDLATAPAPRTVLWLDELQRYLDPPGALSVGVVRGLIAAGMVVVATLWPSEYTTRSVNPTPGTRSVHSSRATPRRNPRRQRSASTHRP